MACIEQQRFSFGEAPARSRASLQDEFSRKKKARRCKRMAGQGSSARPAL